MNLSSSVFFDGVPYKRRPKRVSSTFYSPEFGSERRRSARRDSCEVRQRVLVALEQYPGSHRLFAYEHIIISVIHAMHQVKIALENGSR